MEIFSKVLKCQMSNDRLLVQAKSKDLVVFENHLWSKVMI